MNEEALVKIFDQYSSALYKYALRLCGDPVRADHIVGDVFTKLLEQLSAGNGPKVNLRSYLYEATYHHLIDEVRFARYTAPLEALTFPGADTSSAGLSLEDQIMFRQILPVIRDELTDDQRHAIVLRFLEGFSLRETATIMGKTVDNVKVIQNRALAKIRKSLEHTGIRKVRSSPKFSNWRKALGL